MKSSHLLLVGISMFAFKANGQALLSVYGLHDAGLLVDPDCQRCSVVRGNLAARHTDQIVPASAARAQSAFALPSLVHGNRAVGVSVAYQAGPVSLRLAHQSKQAFDLAAPGALTRNGASRNTILAANMDLGAGTAYAAISANRGARNSPFWNPDNPYGAALPITASGNSRDALLGVAIPHGKLTLLASLIGKHDVELAHYNTRQLALGASYASSRHTDFYVACSRLQARGAGAAEAGVTVNLGMRYGF